MPVFPAHGDDVNDPRASGATATCLLLIGDRVVLRGTAPPEAEYVLFEIGEIELRASEPGRVREHGYQTTAALARERLENLGFTSALAHELGRAMQPVLSDAYARGTAVRRVARYLGPAELFQSDGYDGSARVYRGVFLDLVSLVRDLGMEHASSTLQALYLATVLEAERPETTIVLSTDACTKGAKPGARTFKRPTFAAPKCLLNALGGLAQKSPRPQIADALPREDVIAFLRTRAELAADEDARALYESLEGTVSIREMPEKGPLADPELWAIEMRMESGSLERIIDAIDAAERRQGRTPGTTYLRARAALALRLEQPRLIAERVSALALSMTSFHELGLLAAEAWLEAGDSRRAMPYARDLVDTALVDDGLMLRAQRLLARVVGAAPDTKQTLVDSLHAAPQPSRPPPSVAAPSAPPFPPLLEPPELDPDFIAPPRKRAKSHAPVPVPSFDSGDLVPIPSTPPVAEPSRRPLSAPLPFPTPPESSGFDLAPPPPPSRPPGIDEPTADPAASFTLDLPGPDAGVAGSTAPAAPTSSPQRESARPKEGPRLSGVMMETRPPPSHDPRAEPDSPMVPRTRSNPDNRRVSVPSPEAAGPAPARRASISSGITPALPPLVARDVPASSYMHGASLPPYRDESPAPLLPRAPLLPKLAADELAEHLTLPPGLGGGDLPLDALPTSVLEARVQFTLLARELGLDYRLKRRIELRADLGGIEAMQSVLLETFSDHVVTTSDQAYELRRHGALLSEILSRTLDAEWLDISPNELGYWVMIVPPNTRVWPFGRIARLIAMGHKERDLVSYYLELQSRARGR